MNRTWFYNKMMGNVSLVAALPGGVHETTAILKTPDQKPFLIYRSTSVNSTLRGDDQDRAMQEGFMVFIHDVAGDYLRVDGIIEQVRQLFRDANAGGDTAIISVTWLETSEDLRDDDLGTIFRYSRFQVNRRAA